MSKHRTRRRWIWRSLLAVVVILVIVYWQLIVYGVGQARGQFTIIRGARPVAEVLADSTTPPAVREGLLQVHDIRDFAFDSLRLTRSDNYTTFYDQQGRDLMFVVTACAPYAMEAKRWSFPIVGSFPYKGYFDSVKAEREADIWRAEGYDVRVRVAGGWSTLGYFTDPILSKMLDRSEGALAELIIHELTHATIFVKDSVEFNENLATFIGEQGAVLYLKSRYGASSPQLAEYLAGQKNGRVFAKHMIRGAQTLDSLYGTFSETNDTTYREQQKWQMIRSIVTALDTLTYEGSGRYGRRLQEELPNNAYFMSLLRYRDQQDTLEAWYQEAYHGDLMRLLADMKDRYPSL